MNTQKQLRILLGAAILLLIAAGGLAAWMGNLVLDPVRLADAATSGSSILTDPRAYFKTAELTGTVGQPVAVPVWIDSNGGSLAAITAVFNYNPLDMSVAIDTTQHSVCSQFTKQDDDQVAGNFTVQCTAPTGNGSAVAAFVTFEVTPHHAGTLPVELIGRTSDYAVVVAQ